MHFADPTGVVHSTFVGVKDPGVVRGRLAFDALIHGIDAEIAVG
jgi:hypothetical protein